MKKLAVFLTITLFAFALSAQNNKDKEAVAVAKITQEQFKELIFDYSDTAALYKGKKSVIVDFYADWCGPCRRMSPILDELANDYADDVVFYKINVDENKELARLFDIRNIPTLLFIKSKQRPQKAIGGYEKAQLIEIIDSYLLEKTKEKE